MAAAAMAVSATSSANQLDPQCNLLLQMMIQQQQYQQPFQMPYDTTPLNHTCHAPMPTINNATSSDSSDSNAQKRNNNGIEDSTITNNVVSRAASNDNDSTAAASQISGATTGAVNYTSNNDSSTNSGGVANVSGGGNVNVGSDNIDGGDVIPLCSEVGSNAPPPPPFTKGQRVSLEEYDKTMTIYAVTNGYELQRSFSNKKDRANEEYWNTYYK